MAKKILIADDDLTIVKLIASRLKANKYEVVTASDGVQAVAVAHREKPDLIILDIMMPAGSGLTVCENLHKSVDTSIIPLVFITANATEEIRKKGMEMGAAAFIAKPFDGEELVFKIKQILGQE